MSTTRMNGSLAEIALPEAKPDQHAEAIQAGVETERELVAIATGIDQRRQREGKIVVNPLAGLIRSQRQQILAAKCRAAHVKTAAGLVRR